MPVELQTEWIRRLKLALLQLDAVIVVTNLQSFHSFRSNSLNARLAVLCGSANEWRRGKAGNAVPCSMMQDGRCARFRKDLRVGQVVRARPAERDSTGSGHVASMSPSCAESLRCSPPRARETPSREWEVFPPSAPPLGLGCMFVASSNGNELRRPRACPLRLSRRDTPRLGGTRVACAREIAATLVRGVGEGRDKPPHQRRRQHVTRVESTRGVPAPSRGWACETRSYNVRLHSALTADERSTLAEMQPGSVVETRLSSVAQVRRERSVHAKTAASLVWGVGEGGRRERKKKETHENSEASS
ncbi:hypothetical protein C8J57DRAFT_1221958 [Mycena rebaudengoi]|nr:hypothetical protein C8J57DRAFT_1221958 [Mycena rebaudengoi]